MRRSGAIAALLATLVGTTGCGSSGQSGPPVMPPVIPRPEAAQPPAPPPTNTPTPGASTSPDFVSENVNEGGAKVRLEGRFGPPRTLDETDADVSAVEECQYADKREMTVRLDLTITLQSSLAGKITIAKIEAPVYGSMTRLLPAFLMDYTDGLSCHREVTDAPSINFEEVQPNQPQHFTLWIVLGDVVTPNDPHPSLQTLASQKWFIEPPRVIMDNQILKQVDLKGPRVAECPPLPKEALPPQGYLEKELNVIAGMPRLMAVEEKGLCYIASDY